MAEFVIQGGARIDIPSRAEIKDTLAGELDARERQQAKGWKWMRLPEVLSAVVASNAVKAGIASGQAQLGPEEGYAWSLRRLLVTGLATGATPDVVNLYRNDRFAGPPLWQFNGNNFGYTFGRLELVLQPGDTLSFQNVGSIAAAAGTVILLSGELIEVPAQQLWKLE